MREIKFRAWDKKRKKMFLVSHLDMALEEVILWTDKYKINVNKNQWTDFQDIELMQLTGLKDKNGKEIYEGDIISAGINWVTKKIINYQVYWNQDRWSIKANNSKNIYNLSMSKKRLKKMEVIGNIYENPELFENKEGI